MGRRERKDEEKSEEGWGGVCEEGMGYTYLQMKVLFPHWSGILGNTPLDKEGRKSPLEGMEGASYCITLQYRPLEE